MESSARPASRCFAAELGDCSHDVTREHYISRALLSALGGTVDARGMIWQGDSKMSLSEKALASKILCKHHNNALSPLDAAAVELHRALRGFDAGLRDSTPNPMSDRRTLNGDLVERWFLKTLAGLLASRALSASGMRPEFDWLEVRFGRAKWPTGWGLYMPFDPAPIYAASEFGLDTMVDERDQSLWGARFSVAGHPWLLAFGRPDGSMAYRPASIDFRRVDSSATKTLVFEWTAGAGHPALEFMRVGQYDGPPPHWQS